MNRRRYYKRKRRKILLKRITVILLFVVVIAGTSKIIINKGSDKNFSINDITNENIDQELLRKLKDMAKTDDKVFKVLKNSEQYPEEILELLANNEETIDFVLDYPRNQNVKPKKSIGKISEGEIPKLLQWDKRWGYAKYGDSILAVSGCGPTSLSMVAVALTKDNSITPYMVAKYADENNYYVEETGSSWSLMTEGALHFGVQGRELVLDKNIIFSELENGHPIICSMRPGDFTTTGHFIVFTGIKDGKIQINDPNSMKRSKLWDYDTLEGQINNLWSFTKS